MYAKKKRLTRSRKKVFNSYIRYSVCILLFLFSTISCCTREAFIGRAENRLLERINTSRSYTDKEYIRHIYGSISRTGETIHSSGEKERVEPRHRINNGWRLTSYYTPVRGQLTYYTGSYWGDYNINCYGDCTITASGYKLSHKDKYQVAACPPEIDLGTKIRITLPPDHKRWAGKSWIVTCVDRGGSIKYKCIDLYVGMGHYGWSHPVISEMDSDNATIDLLI